MDGRLRRRVLDRRARHWKHRTLESDDYMVRKCILPAFGHMSVDAIAVKQVWDWFAAMSDRRIHHPDRSRDRARSGCRAPRRP